MIFGGTRIYSFNLPGLVHTFPLVCPLLHKVSYIGGATLVQLCLHPAGDVDCTKNTACSIFGFKQW